MAKILYESSSIRSDCGVLYLTEGEACTLPFIFNIKSRGTDNQLFDYQIAEDDYVEFVIKQHCHDVQTILKKSVTNISANTCVFSLTIDDMTKLQGTHFVMSATLYGKNDLKRVLIKQMPIVVQEVV